MLLQHSHSQDTLRTLLVQVLAPAIVRGLHVALIVAGVVTALAAAAGGR